MTEKLDDGPEHSPSLLGRLPARGIGVRRLNNVPKYIAIGLGVLVTALMMYATVARGNIKHKVKDNSLKASQGATPPREVAQIPLDSYIGETPVANPIPLADLQANQGPQVPAINDNPSPNYQNSGTISQPKPSKYAEQWAAYTQKQMSANQARESALSSALGAPSNVPIARSSNPLNTSTPNSAQSNQRLVSNYSSAVRTQVISPYELKAGSIIPAIMISGINSDLPGQVIAQVSENVFDTKTGQHLLIPQGSRLIGTYDSSIQTGQTRVMLIWTRIIFPDASSMDLEMMPASDQSGYAGINDKTNNHYAKTFGSALLMSMFSAGAQLSQPQAANGQNYSPSQTATAAMGQQLSQTGSQVIARNLAIQPTLQIRSGYRFNVSVTKDLVISP